MEETPRETQDDVAPACPRRNTTFNECCVRHAVLMNRKGKHPGVSGCKRPHTPFYHLVNPLRVRPSDRGRSFFFYGEDVVCAMPF